MHSVLQLSNLIICESNIICRSVLNVTKIATIYQMLLNVVEVCLSLTICLRTSSGIRRFFFLPVFRFISGRRLKQIVIEKRSPNFVSEVGRDLR